MIQSSTDLKDLEKALGSHILEGGVQAVAIRANIRKAFFDFNKALERMEHQPQYKEAIFTEELTKVPLWINSKDNTLRAIAKARLQIRK